MIVVDTSVWIPVLRGRPREMAARLAEALGGEPPVFLHPIGAELLRGAADEAEWQRLSAFLATQRFADAKVSAWSESARIFFDLRRRGLTVRSLVDCYLAQIALDHDALLLHQDRDFSAIAEVRPLKNRLLEA